MKLRFVAALAMTLLLATALWAIHSQGRRIQTLRAGQREQVRLLSGTTREPGAENGTRAAGPRSARSEMDSEILKLRNEVAQLARLQRDLQPVRTEHERLQKQLASARTNATPGLPPGYLRKSQAKFAGYGTPEATLQSFLWAIHNRDTTNIQRALTPESLRLVRSMPSGGEGLADQMQAFVGASVLESQSLPDGSSRMRIEIMPGLPATYVRYWLVDGEWKMDLPR